MPQDVYERLKDASDSGAAVYLNPPCDEAMVESFSRQLQTVLGQEAPWYVPLLRVTDGLQIDNSIFYSSRDVGPLNADYRTADQVFERYLAFGHNGNVDLYVFDQQRAAQPFCVVNFYGVEDIYEAYPSLEAMLAATLDAALR